MRRTVFKIIGLSGICIVIATFIFFFFHQPDFEVDFFDVGQGDATLVRSGFDEMLIDGGPDRSVLTKLGNAMPMFDRTIEYVVLTHPHADHFTGLISVLGRYHVDTLILTGARNTTSEYHTFENAVQMSGVKILYVVAGDTLFLGNHLQFHVLSSSSLLNDSVKTEDYNDASIVLRMFDTFSSHDHHDADVLFMGDATTRIEDHLLSTNTELHADILKVGHHGSRFSSSSDFLEKVHPHDAVISVGKNSYGHPAWATLERLKLSGIKIWRTDHDGDVRVVWKYGHFIIFTRSGFGW